MKLTVRETTSKKENSMGSIEEIFTAIGEILIDLGVGSIGSSDPEPPA